MSLPVDVVAELRAAVVRGQLMLAVPWVAQLLRMAQKDRVSMATAGTRRALDALRAIRVFHLPAHGVAPRSAAAATAEAGRRGMSNGALFVLAEIETLFEHLQLSPNSSPAAAPLKPLVARPDGQRRALICLVWPTPEHGQWHALIDCYGPTRQARVSRRVGRSACRWM